MDPGLTFRPIYHLLLSGLQLERWVRAIPRQRRRDRVGERRPADRAEARGVRRAVEQNRMCPQMPDVGRATCRRVKHARSGQQPVRHTEDRAVHILSANRFGDVRRSWARGF